MLDKTLYMRRQILTLGIIGASIIGAVSFPQPVKALHEQEPNSPQADDVTKLLKGVDRITGAVSSKDTEDIFAVTIPKRSRRIKVKSDRTLPNVVFTLVRDVNKNLRVDSQDFIEGFIPSNGFLDRKPQFNDTTYLIQAKIKNNNGNIPNNNYRIDLQFPPNRN